MSVNGRVRSNLLPLALTGVLLISMPVLSDTRRSPVAPSHDQIQTIVTDAYSRFKNDTSGKNADYIPELAKVDPKLFGIAIVTTDNQVLTVGDVTQPFSIQSISKVFTLALAMDEFGPDKVFQKIGSEPTGRPFNSPDAV